MAGNGEVGGGGGGVLARSKNYSYDNKLVWGEGGWKFFTPSWGWGRGFMRVTLKRKKEGVFFFTPSLIKLRHFVKEFNWQGPAREPKICRKVSIDQEDYKKRRERRALKFARAKWVLLPPEKKTRMKIIQAWSAKILPLYLFSFYNLQETCNKKNENKKAKINDAVEKSSLH